MQNIHTKVFFFPLHLELSMQVAFPPSLEPMAQLLEK